MYRRFCNISLATADRMLGFRVNVSHQGVLHQPYIPGISDSCLESALDARNALWWNLHTTARGILLPTMAEPETEPDPEFDQFTQRARIRERNISRAPQPRDAYVVHIRNLKTRRKTLRRVYLDEFFREGQALAHAIHLRDSNLNAYNALVQHYNTEALDRALRAADRETSLLMPCVYLLRKFDSTLWANALLREFPATSHKRLTSCQIQE